MKIFDLNRIEGAYIPENKFTFLNKIMCLRNLHVVSTFFFFVVLINYNNCLTQTNFTCETATDICHLTEFDYDYSSDTSLCNSPLYYTFLTNGNPTVANSITSLYSSSGTVSLFGPFYFNNFNICNELNDPSSFISSESFDNITPGYFLCSSPGYYILKIQFDNCYQDLNNTFVNGFSLGFISSPRCPDVGTFDLPCQDCITSFSPTPGKYLVSAWVKEDGASMNTTTYANSSINVSFSGDPYTVSLIPLGQIIDGWQRVEGIIDVPVPATDIHLSFETSSGTSYYDDIRFHPLDGSMMSYVYDPISLRLMAELDERNYATLYEYDEEGKLIRVKKETEKGIMTIQENRDNITKQ